MNTEKECYQPVMEDVLLDIFHQLGRMRKINVLYAALRHMQSYNGQSEGGAIARGMYECLTTKEHIAVYKHIKRIIEVPEVKKKKKKHSTALNRGKGHII